MPRDGSGASHNAAGEQPEHNIAHGDAGADSGVDRSNKAAPLPETEKGAAIKGLNASGGGAGITSADKEAEKQ